MRKTFIFCLSVLLLTACTGKDEQTQDANNSNDGSTAQTTKPENNQPDGTGNNKVHEEKSADSSAANEDQSDYTELPVVLEKIGNDEYEEIVKTDNANKRVILFEDQNHNKLFKSIYIKHDNRLKVIDLAKDQMIFNEVI